MTNPIRLPLDNGVSPRHDGSNPASVAGLGQDRVELLDVMGNLLPSQLDAVIFRLGVSEEHLPGRTSTLSERATDLIRLLEPQRNGLTRIVAAIRAVAPDLVWRSALPLPAAEATWDAMMAALRSYPASSIDDVVLCMHPDAEREWRTVVPNADQGIEHITIKTPEGPWHRQTIDHDTWARVQDEIVARLGDLTARRPRRVHLVTRTPYSLGALLGARLDPQNHRLFVYQLDNRDGSRELKEWRLWGPEWPMNAGTRTETFFEPVAGLERPRPEEEGDIALVINITGGGDPRSCVEGAHPRRGPVRPLVARARTTGQYAIRTPADADKASVELDTLLQRAAENLPNAVLHLFYYGPLAVLLRASRGLGFRRTPIIVYESCQLDNKPRWVPAVEFPEGKLMI